MYVCDFNKPNNWKLGDSIIYDEKTVEITDPLRIIVDSPKSSIDFTYKEAPPVYTKITSIKDLTSGGKYLLYHETSKRALKANLNATDIGESNNTQQIDDLTSRVEDCEFTITLDNNNYVITNQDSQVLGSTASGNISYNDSFRNKIAFNNDNVYIEPRNLSFIYLIYNPDDSRMYYYGLSSTTILSIQLYKYTGE